MANTFWVDPDAHDIRYLGKTLYPSKSLPVTAACALIRKDAFDAVQGMDELLRGGLRDVDCVCAYWQKLAHTAMPCGHLIHHESLHLGQKLNEDPPRGLGRIVGAMERLWRLETRITTPACS